MNLRAARKARAEQKGWAAQQPDSSVVAQPGVWALLSAALAPWRVEAAHLARRLQRCLQRCPEMVSAVRYFWETVEMLARFDPSLKLR